MTDSIADLLTMEAGIPDGYIIGVGRDYPHPTTAHLYKGTFARPGLPMCRRGWNRDAGQSYSIWRNYAEPGTRLCAICCRRAREGRPAKRAREVTP